MGPPKFFDTSLPACHGLRTPADLHILAITDALVLPSVNVKTLGVRNKLISKLYQHFRERGLPYGLQDSLCTLHLSCSPLFSSDSATDATLDTGGWLALTRQGLSPCKIRQASLGAITADEIWRTYILLTRVEAAFRSMKSPLMERPIFHHLKNLIRRTSFCAYLLITCSPPSRRDSWARGFILHGGTSANS